MTVCCSYTVPRGHDVATDVIQMTWWHHRALTVTELNEAKRSTNTKISREFYTFMVGLFSQQVGPVETQLTQQI